jgi:hypothetical protein
MKLAVPWENKWPQIKKGDYNGLFLTSIHILYSGCHHSTSFTSTNYTSSNDAIHGIIYQASISMVSLCGESISDYKVRANSLVNLFNGSMHCIHSPDCILYFLQEHL